MCYPEIQPVFPKYNVLSRDTARFPEIQYVISKYNVLPAYMSHCQQFYRDGVLVPWLPEGGQEMDDERDQGDEEEAQGLAGDVRSRRLRRTSSRSRRRARSDCSIWRARASRLAPQAGQGGFLRLLGVEDLLQHAACRTRSGAARRWEAADRPAAPLDSPFARSALELGEDLGLQADAGRSQRAPPAGRPRAGPPPAATSARRAGRRAPSPGHQGDDGESHPPGGAQGSFPHAQLLRDGRDGGGRSRRGSHRRYAGCRSR